jgi:hypothetical protein
MNTADQCDTIVGRSAAGTGTWWDEARLTLLWLGETVAVWRVQQRHVDRQQWGEPRESAGWTLDHRQLKKVEQ